jgi:hypothetical protein
LLSQASDPFCWFHDTLYSIALTTQLVTTQESLAKEKTARSAAEQALQNSNDAKAKLTQEQESTKASLTATLDKLTSKSAALDVTVIREQ